MLRGLRSLPSPHRCLTVGQPAHSYGGRSGRPGRTHPRVRARSPHPLARHHDASGHVARGLLGAHPRVRRVRRRVAVAGRRLVGGDRPRGGVGRRVVLVQLAQARVRTSAPRPRRPAGPRRRVLLPVGSRDAVRSGLGHPRAARVPSAPGASTCGVGGRRRTRGRRRDEPHLPRRPLVHRRRRRLDARSRGRRGDGPCAGSATDRR